MRKDVDLAKKPRGGSVMRGVGDSSKLRAEALELRLREADLIIQDLTERLESASRRQEELVREEREACVMLAYNYPRPDPGGSWRESIAAAIRRRGPEPALAASPREEPT